MAMKRLPVISLFSGALGLDLGLEAAGFEIRVAVECDAVAVETIKQNRPELPVIARKLEDMTTDEILSRAGLEKGEAAVVTGGPSCQPFSTAGRRGSVNDPRGVMFHEFCRVVREAAPEYFIMENVKGVLSAAVKHRPLKERGPGFPPLEPEEELGSALVLVARELRALEYFTVFDVLNAADFGVPQARERVLFLGSRDGRRIERPTPTHDREAREGRAPWLTLREALEDLEDPEPVYTAFSPGKSKYLKLVPEGGNWRDLPEHLQEDALGGAFRSWGGRVGFYRRLGWNRTPPALTSRPDCKATMFCHPTELRPLSVREYARIQQFPDEWSFSGGPARQYLQIGNAFPAGLGTTLGHELQRARRRNPNPERLGRVACADEDLLRRLAHGNRTNLNPPRMRKIKDAAAANEWLNKMADEPKRQEILEHVELLDEVLNGRSDDGGAVQVA